jgi:hypothetical protein
VPVALAQRNAVDAGQVQVEDDEIVVFALEQVFRYLCLILYLYLKKVYHRIELMK